MNVVLGITGATGAVAADLFVRKSPFPVALVASRPGREVYEFECGKPFAELAETVAVSYDNHNLWAPIASGSVRTAGMVILPCSIDTLGQIASGRCETLLARAAHCHLKSRRPLILCLRESPVTAIDLDNARRLAEAGAVVMPISPPFYMFAGRDPREVSMSELLEAFVDRVLQLLGHEPERTWETVR